VALALRRQILIFNLVVMVPVLALIAWAARQTYAEQIQQLREETRAMAATIVVYLERGLELKALQTVIQSIPLPADSIIFVTDEFFMVMAQSVEPEQYVGHRAVATPQNLDDMPDYTQQVGADGVERVFANDVFEDGRLLVSVGIPTEVAYHRVAPIYRRNVGIAMAVIAFTVLLQLLLLQSYSKAFDRAIHFARRVAAGDLSSPSPIPMPSREMEQIQASVIEMVNKMRDAREAIAAQVREERRIREELQSLQRQVIRQERLAAIGVLVSGIAHELNNPLQAILGFSELLQLRNDLPEAATQDLALIQKESTRASAIIRNLSRFSRQTNSAATTVRLLDVVASVVELRQRKIDQDDIELMVVEQRDPLVHAVFAELQQVVLNFLINAEQAVMHAPAPRLISITVDERGGNACLEVQDSGPGVPHEDEPKLFQPFFTTKPVGEGTGLGLSVSYGIIQSHGGRIGYRRAPAGGAIFHFDLPALAPGQKNA
jgi:C4-dicarboxylate-specific signal transduction histidine kinase